MDQSFKASIRVKDIFNQLVKSSDHDDLHESLHACCRRISLTIVVYSLAPDDSYAQAKHEQNSSSNPHPLLSVASIFSGRDWGGSEGSSRRCTFLLEEAPITVEVCDSD
jgi:hypothetical protein